MKKNGNNNNKKKTTQGIFLKPNSFSLLQELATKILGLPDIPPHQDSSPFLRSVEMTLFAHYFVSM